MRAHPERRRQAATVILNAEPDSCAVVGLLNHHEDGCSGVFEQGYPDGLTLLLPIRCPKHIVNKRDERLTLFVEIHHGTETALTTVRRAYRVLEPVALKFTIPAQ